MPQLSSEFLLTEVQWQNKGIKHKVKHWKKKEISWSNTIWKKEILIVEAGRKWIRQEIRREVSTRKESKDVWNIRHGKEVDANSEYFILKKSYTIYNLENINI